jgi:hypothetical protein
MWDTKFCGSVVRPPVVRPPVVRPLVRGRRLERRRPLTAVINDFQATSVKFNKLEEFDDFVVAVKKTTS